MKTYIMDANQLGQFIQVLELLPMAAPVAINCCRTTLIQETNQVAHVEEDFAVAIDINGWINRRSRREAHGVFGRNGHPRQQGDRTWQFYHVLPSSLMSVSSIQMTPLAQHSTSMEE